MQVSCLKSKRNMVSGAKGDAPEVVGRHFNMMLIQTQQTSSTRCRVLDLAKSLQGRGTTPWPGAGGRRGKKKCVLRSEKE